MNRLKELREDAAMTVRELSGRSGVSEDTITKLENSHRKGRGMTMRKLAKALSTTPEQLFPEDFKQRSSATTSVPEILAQDDLLGSRVLDARPSPTDVRGIQALEDAVAGAYEVVQAVERSAEKVSLQTRVLDRMLTLISERQQKMLIAVLECGDVGPSAVANQMDIDVSTAYRDLSVLEEHEMVQASESGKLIVTPFGKEVAEAIMNAWGELRLNRSSQDKSYYDEALGHIATLMRAYEEVARFAPRRLTEIEAESLSSLQESILRSVERIAAAARHPAPINKAQENLWANVVEREGREFYTKMVQAVFDQVMSSSSPQTELEDLPEGAILMALDAVIDAHDVGQGSADPHEKLRRNLKRRSPTTQQGNVDDPQ